MTENSADVSPTRVFFISPIGEDGSPERDAADKVRKYLVDRAFPRSDGFKVDRADDDTNPGSITPRIIGSIQEADLIVADLSGLNPNVFYELAVAHGYQKPVVLIFTKSEQRIPFDLKDMRTVHYVMTDIEMVEQAQRQLRSYGDAALNHPDAIVTPLTAAGRFLAVEQSTDPQVDALAELTEQIQAMRRSVSSLLSKEHETNPTAVDTVAVRDLVEDLAGRGIVSADALEGLAGDYTSGWFDAWARGLAEKVRNQPDPWSSPSAGSKADPWAAPAVGDDEPPF